MLGLVSVTAQERSRFVTVIADWAGGGSTPRGGVFFVLPSRISLIVFVFLNRYCFSP